jgi:hypothetical protein
VYCVRVRSPHQCTGPALAVPGHFKKTAAVLVLRGHGPTVTVLLSSFASLQAPCDLVCLNRRLSVNLPVIMSQSTPTVMYSQGGFASGAAVAIHVDAPEVERRARADDQYVAVLVAAV